MQRVIVDANVVVSFFVERSDPQRTAASELLQSSADSEIAAVVPQFVIFEVAYVLLSRYGVSKRRLTSMLRDLLALPGVLTADECPWRDVFEMWPEPFDSLADAAVVALARSGRYDAVATFDQAMIRRMRLLGVGSYW